MSHTVTIDVKFKNETAVEAAAREMNATILGQGNHRLFGSAHTGMGIKFGNWNYPVIIDKDGKIVYDNYGGAWGSYSMLEKFQEIYAAKVIEAECAQLGWYCQRNDQTGELTIIHPDGGTITVSKGGTIDANGFTGNTCEVATERFEQALGTKLGAALKPYLNEVQVKQGQE